MQTNHPMTHPVRGHAPLGLATPVALLASSNAFLDVATTAAVKEGDKVVLQNEQVRVEYDLAKGPDCASSSIDQAANGTVDWFGGL